MADVAQPILGALIAVVGATCLIGTPATPAPALQPSGWTEADIAQALSRPPLRRLGRLEGTQCEMVGQIRDAILDDHGRVIVLDRIAQSISVFDDAGRCAYTIGRKGGGPGEFRSTTHLLFTGGHLLVLDAGNRRIERFELGDRSAVASRPFDCRSRPKDSVGPTRRSISVSRRRAASSIA